ncbi:MAG TPA: glycosyltransferase family 4 protein [Candidatus Bathyarchaeia archaeon]|nr:glycosyltransferase family 4 protein [Candidatus Bathyarchaeia archaeon]
MSRERCRILFVNSFDVRLIDSKKTDGSVISQLEEVMLKYKGLCDLLLFTGDTIKFDLTPPIEHLPSALFHKFGLWHLSYMLLGTFKIAKHLKGKSLVRGFNTGCPGAILATKIKNKPSMVFYEYNWAYQVANINKGKIFGAVAEVIENYVIRNADVIVARHKSLEKEAYKRGAKRVVLIPYSVDEAVFKPGIAVEELKEFYNITDEKVLMYIGRLHPVKRLRLLLESVAKLQENFKMFIVGAGALEEELEEYAKLLGINDKVIFTGAVQFNDIPKYMNLADVIVLTSAIEGQPRVIVESMFCGTPAVGTNVFGISDTIADGVTGYLTSTDPEDIANKISKALQDDQLSVACREYALQNYSRETANSKELAIAKELLGWDD